jgi:hypothetical protein
MLTSGGGRRSGMSGGGEQKYAPLRVPRNHYAPACNDRNVGGPIPPLA